MPDIKYYWDGNRKQRAKAAKEWTKKMAIEHRDLIEQCVKDSEICLDYLFEKDSFQDAKLGIDIQLWEADTVSAIFEVKRTHGYTPTIGVLNFASFKHPGGGFLLGSRAQEECLCQSSYLFNVLCRFPQYYEVNSQKLNHGLYADRALYSPNVMFFNESGYAARCDVITCAAPNITPARRHNNQAILNLNEEALTKRCEYVLNVAARHGIDVLILGAFGCGAFGQDAEQVINIFLKLLEEYKYFDKVIFAIPRSIHSENYEAAAKAFKDYRNIH